MLSVGWDFEFLKERRQFYELNYTGFACCVDTLCTEDIPSIVNYVIHIAHMGTSELRQWTSRLIQQQASPSTTYWSVPLEAFVQAYVCQYPTPRYPVQNPIISRLVIIANKYNRIDEMVYVTRTVFEVPAVMWTFYHLGSHFLPDEPRLAENEDYFEIHHRYRPRGTLIGNAKTLLWEFSSQTVSDMGHWSSVLSFLDVCPASSIFGTSATTSLDLAVAGPIGHGDSVLHLVVSLPDNFVDLVKIVTIVIKKYQEQNKIDMKNSHGLTALAVASALGAPRWIINALLDAGADCRAADNMGKTPYDHAIANHRKWTGLSNPYETIMDALKGGDLKPFALDKTNSSFSIWRRLKWKDNLIEVHSISEAMPTPRYVNGLVDTLNNKAIPIVPLSVLQCIVIPYAPSFDRKNLFHYLHLNSPFANPRKLPVPHKCIFEGNADQVARSSRAEF